MPWANSKLSAFLIKIPCFAPCPVPTIIEVGVANPSAQGQAIIKTSTIVIKARVRLPVRRIQNKKVITAIIITTGTK